MDTAIAPSPFPALLQGLASFHDRVAGDEGDYRETMLLPGQPALARTTSLEVLGVVRNLLVWLRNGVEWLHTHLVSIDAVLAVSEVAKALLQELDGTLAVTVPGLGAATAEVTTGLSALGTAAQALPDSTLLPDPALVAELRSVLEQLVGVAEGGPSTGTLDQLMTDIQGLDP